MEFKYSEQPALIKEMLKPFNDKTEDKKIEKVKKFNDNAFNKVILYPTDNVDDLDALYLKYMMLDPDDKAESDDKAIELFGDTNPGLYKLFKSNIKVTTDDPEDTYTVKDEEIEDEVANESVFTNDLPIFTPNELVTKIEEDYSCFSEEEAEVIKAWREGYALLGNGIKTESYNKMNLDRISILRKAIYENNTDAILQCGWIPGVEFNSENRVKASQLVKEKMELPSIISYESIEEATKSTIDKNYKNKGKKNLSSFKKVHITESVINKYKKEYPFLKHVRCKDTKEYICDGYIWFDKNDLVAMVGSCEYTDDKTKWIVSLEITKNYKGYGLSKQIVDYAVKHMNCKYLSVNKNNEVAKKVYDDYGFRVYQDSDTMYYMTIDKNINESVITEAASKDKKAVSVVFVAGSSMLAKTIRKVQDTEFSHASISLDDDLSRIYSYNMRNGFNGLTYESVKGYIEEGVQKMGVYTFLVSDKVYKKLEKQLENFNLYIDKTKYSVLNLLTIAANIPLDMDMKMVCSEFVDKLLKMSDLDLTNKKSSLVGPKDLINAANTKSNIVEVFYGHPKKFKPKEVEKRIKKLRKSDLPIYEFVEYDDEVITEAKSLPIQFDKDGNLIVKNLRRIDFEQEYANSHRILMQYEKSNSYEPMKFELAKMQFLITLLEKKIYKNGKDKSMDELKVRARYLNDFNKYLKLVMKNEPSFNFSEYFEQSPFNDALIKIDKDTLKFGYKALKYIIKG